MNRFSVLLLVVLSLGFAPFLVKARKPGQQKKVEIAPGVKMVFCWVPAGKATLGSPKDEKGRAENEQEHEFSTKGFWLGKYPVTQEQWQAVMGYNPSNFNGKNENKAKGLDTSLFPVEAVSWHDCQAFIQKVNQHLGKGKVSLPHEDEWEYACRGGKGNKQPFYWGNSLNGKQANCDGTVPYGTAMKGPDLERTTKVGSYETVAPHPWRLCDMVGNVSQWCDNLYKPMGTGRVLRAGSCFSYAPFCRPARRYASEPGSCSQFIGCRLLLRQD
jgi:formylglycine-generating enzyme required for sulfatase activity